MECLFQIVGKAKIMKFLMKFYSGTFGGKHLKSDVFTIKYLKNKIIEKNIKKGKFLLKNLIS